MERCGESGASAWWSTMCTARTSGLHARARGAPGLSGARTHARGARAGSAGLLVRVNYLLLMGASHRALPCRVASGGWLRTPQNVMVICERAARRV